MSARTRQFEIKTRWLHLAAPILAIVLGASAGAQTRPATEPATRPTHLAKDVAHWFAELVHPDAATRVQAMTQLMGLDASDLPTLREVVKKNRPLAVAQASVLRQIVTQVFLASETYDVASDQGFLGIFMPPLETPDATDGALVSERCPGFVSMQMLHEGDVILSVQLPAKRPVRIHSPGELTSAMTGAKAGNKVQLEVLRQGQIIDVVVRLDPRPAQAEVGIEAMRDFNRQRQDRADAYWDKNFASLLRETVSMDLHPLVFPHFT
ncbi:MAG TPA: PDZ domain-containing protein [Tepidisphaeraceae bacterium]|nr:PDZ domain-containing protein [Tepidisphaeraceae bacterium]